MKLLSMNQDNLTSKEDQVLLPLSFRTDDTHFAAPARTRPRPLDACNRVIVEFCCAEVSKLGEKRNASKGCSVIRVLKRMTLQNNLQSKDSARISAPSSATRGDTEHSQNNC